MANAARRFGKLSTKYRITTEMTGSRHAKMVEMKRVRWAMLSSEYLTRFVWGVAPWTLSGLWSEDQISLASFKPS